MLRSINEAHEFIAQEVAKLTGEKIDADELAILEELFEDGFFEKINEVVSDEEFEQAKLKDPDQLEGFLFHRVPNYMTLLEETAIEVVADYLSEEESTSE
jgi:hypothetical protein